MKKAFTLAEVLITLGIIGIVAAMTLPTLIQKNQDRQLIAQTKKVYADINNAILLAQKDYGVVGDNGFLFNTTDTSAQVAKKLSKYFAGSKVCSSATQKGCPQYYYERKYATLRKDSDGAAATDNFSFPKIILANGAIIDVSTNMTGCTPTEYTDTRINEYGQVIKDENGNPETYTYISDTCANLRFDVNGPKQPHQFGRDNYHLWVSKNKIKPAADYLGGKSLKNILTGKDKLEYLIYAKGQIF